MSTVARVTLGIVIAIGWFGYALPMIFDADSKYAAGIGIGATFIAVLLIGIYLYKRVTFPPFDPHIRNKDETKRNE